MKALPQWKKALLESMVIIASILLAFWIDAWWEARQNRELETQIIAAVIAELNSNVEHTQSVISSHIEGLDYIDRFIQSTPEELSSPSGEEFLNSISKFPFSESYVPLVSASTMFVASPALTPIGIELRNIVGEYLRLLSEVALISVDGARANVIDSLSEYAMRDTTAGLSSINGKVAKLGRGVLAELRTDSRFLHALTQKIHVQNVQRQRLVLILAETESIKARLEEELD